MNIMINQQKKEGKVYLKLKLSTLITTIYPLNYQLWQFTPQTTKIITMYMMWMVSQYRIICQMSHKQVSLRFSCLILATMTLRKGGHDSLPLKGKSEILQLSSSPSNFHPTLIPHHMSHPILNNKILIKFKKALSIN